MVGRESNKREGAYADLLFLVQLLQEAGAQVWDDDIGVLKLLCADWPVFSELPHGHACGHSEMLAILEDEFKEVHSLITCLNG